MQDFRDTVWLPIRDLWHGGNPYDTPNYLHRVPQDASGFFLYTPAILLLLSPLAALPWNAAVVAWTAVDVILMMWLARETLSLARLPRRVDIYLAVLSLLLLLLPTQLLFQTGNPSTLVICGAVFVIGRGADDWKTAAAVALCLLKLQFGIPVLVLLLAIRLWRPVVRGIAIVAAFSIVPLIMAIHASHGISGFVHSLGTNLSAQRNSAYGNLTTPGAFRWDLAATIGRWTGVNFSLPVQLAFAAVLLLAAGFAFARAAHAAGREMARFGVGALTVMLCLFHNRYDLVSCLPFAVVLLTDAVRGRKGMVIQTRLTGVAGLLVLAVGLHALRIDKTLHIAENAGQILNGVILIVAFVLCVVAALLPSSVRRDEPVAVGPGQISAGPRPAVEEPMHSWVGIRPIRWGRWVRAA